MNKHILTARHHSIPKFGKSKLATATAPGIPRTRPSGLLQRRHRVGRASDAFLLDRPGCDLKSEKSYESPTVGGEIHNYEKPQAL